MVSPAQSSHIQSEGFTSYRRTDKLTCNVLFATLVACLGPLSFGYVLGYASPVKDQIQKRFDWSDSLLSWFNALHAPGAMLGSYIGTYVIDKFGRKLAIMLCSIPFVLGWVMIGASGSTALIYTGRTITGLAAGVVSLTVPVYLAEISPAKYRGTLGSSNQLAVTFGTLLAYCLGPLFDDWRWLAIAGAVPPTLMVLLMSFMPETPRWLVKNNKVSEAIHVLTHLRRASLEQSEEECQEIKNSLGSNETVSLSEVKRPSVYRPLILSVMLMIFQQFGGINSVLTYASTILKKAGFNNATKNAIVIAVVQFVATGISCLVVDKFGRRLLLILPGIVMSFSMALLGASSYTSFPSAVTLISLSLYITGFSMGWGPIPWLAMSEIFPTRVRGIASGIATQVNWLGVFVVVKTFHQIEDAFEVYGAYWFYGGICLLSAIYVFFSFPETKGRTLEEIEQLFSNPGLLDSPSRRYGSVDND